MYIYDLVSLILIGLSHFVLYFTLIRYERISFWLIVLISLVFTLLLGTVITVTGYPEFNAILMGLFLLSLGLLQAELTLFENIYFTMANLVTISLLKIILIELGRIIYIILPFNLYIWTDNVIQMIVMIVIFGAILVLRKQIALFARHIVNSFLYYVSYVVFAISFVVIFLLTMPRLTFLSVIYLKYGEALYISTFILFFILLLIVIVGSHVTKEQLIQEQQQHLDDELLDYVKKLEVLHDELANFRHDYINVLLTLDESVRAGDLPAIKRIYDEVIEPTKEIINHHDLDIVKLANVDVREVKSLLSVKVLGAQQQNVRVMLDIPHTMTSIPVPLVQFIRMISIILDNGIEAAVESDEKLLQVAFFEKGEEVHFIVRNSIVHETIHLNEIYDKDYSNKDVDRGYGLYSLQVLVQALPNVTLETSFERNFFIQKLTLKK